VGSNSARSTSSVMSVSIVLARSGQATRTVPTVPAGDTARVSAIAGVTASGAGRPASTLYGA
jgi:hypothetical protein